MWFLGFAQVAVVERYGSHVTVVFLSGPNAGQHVDNVEVQSLTLI